jgi:hypothetical protein
MGFRLVAVSGGLFPLFRDNFPSPRDVPLPTGKLPDAFSDQIFVVFGFVLVNNSPRRDYTFNRLDRCPAVY